MLDDSGRAIDAALANPAEPVNDIFYQRAPRGSCCPRHRRPPHKDTAASSGLASVDDFMAALDHAGITTHYDGSDWPEQAKRNAATYVREYLAALAQPTPEPDSEFYDDGRNAATTSMKAGSTSETQTSHTTN